MTNFRDMTVQEHRKIASQGGSSCPAEKRSFFTNRALAREAGRKGGHSVKGENRMFSRDRELAREAGRKGGSVRRKGHKA